MIEIKKNIYWCGIKDWGLRVFHGHELSTHRGSTYSAYLIRDEKTVLVDTVWNPYTKEFADKLEKEVGIKNIDAIVINHSEPDHAGSLGYIMSLIPDTPIYCTKNGAEILRRHFHQDWNFHIVKTGDTISIGNYELVFVEMQMIHWPDSMLTYVKGANLVLSNDAFGQHYVTKSLFNDEVDMCEVYEEAIKYYANILTPFSPLIKKKIEQIRAMNLDIDMIAPSHGIIWRDNPMQIIDHYDRWSDQYKEDHVVILYDTMYGSTMKMAWAIADGLAEKNIKYKIYHTAVSDKSDVITEIFKARGVIMGSCTVNNTILSSIAALLDEMKGLKFKGKVGAAFGSYGWSGEGAKHISQKLEDAGFEILHQPLQHRYQPSAEELEQYVEFGRKFAENLKSLA